MEREKIWEGEQQPAGASEEVGRIAGADQHKSAGDILSAEEEKHRLLSAGDREQDQGKNYW